jgi:hypothetical protein
MAIKHISRQFFREKKFENCSMRFVAKKRKHLEALDAPFYFKNVEHRVLRAYAKKKYCDED